MTEEQVAEQPELNTAQESETAQAESPVLPDETEQASDVKTDEQINAEVQDEAKAKAEKRQRSIQRRMDELTREKYAERQAREELQKQNAELMALLKPKAEPQATGAPRQQDYQDYAEYVKAEAVWNAKQEAQALIDKHLQEQSKSQQQVAQSAVERELASTFAKRAAEVAKSIPDYQEVMADADQIEVPNHVLAMIRRLDNGPLIAYHMVKNPALAEKFMLEPPEMHGVILGQLSASLKSPAKISNAPAPGKPAAPKSAASATEPPEDADAYMAWAAKHMR
jgi:hypothetical protein